MSDELRRGDKLILRGLMFHGFHGVLEEERRLGQKFLVDLDAWLDLKKAGNTDNLDDTVSYAEIYNLIKAVVEGPSVNLLETVASDIVKKIFTCFPKISAVRVQLGKPHVAVQGPIDYLGIEIHRQRENIE